MPSEIRYKENDSMSNSGELISFCAGSASEVLAHIYNTHSIVSFNSIVAPVGNRNGYHHSRDTGLVVRDVTEAGIALPGTSLMINTPLVSIALEEARLETPRNDEAIKEGFKKSIATNLESGWASSRQEFI